MRLFAVNGCTTSSPPKYSAGIIQIVGVYGDFKQHRKLIPFPQGKRTGLSLFGKGAFDGIETLFEFVDAGVFGVDLCLLRLHCFDEHGDDVTIVHCLISLAVGMDEFGQNLLQLLRDEADLPPIAKVHLLEVVAFPVITHTAHIKDCGEGIFERVDVGFVAFIGGLEITSCAEYVSIEVTGVVIRSRAIHSITINTDAYNPSIMSTCSNHASGVGTYSIDARIIDTHTVDAYGVDTLSNDTLALGANTMHTYIISTLSNDTLTVCTLTNNTNVIRASPSDSVDG